MFKELTAKSRNQISSAAASLTFRTSLLTNSSHWRTVYALPSAVQFITSLSKPYPGGPNGLYKLNKWYASAKHDIIIPLRHYARSTVHFYVPHLKP